MSVEIPCRSWLGGELKVFSVARRLLQKSEQLHCYCCGLDLFLDEAALMRDSSG